MINKRVCAYFISIAIFWIYSAVVSVAQLKPIYNVYDSTYYPKSKQGDFKNFLYHLNYFPPIPRNQYEIGIHTGIVNISGNVASKVTPLGLDISVRKALGYIFSLRGQYVFGIARGTNQIATQILTTEQETYQRYLDNGITSVVKNYQTTMHHISLQVLINLTNIDFSRRYKKYNFYLLGGVGYIFQNTLLDAFKGDNLYTYNGSSTFADALDGNYETKAAAAANKNAISFTAGAGFQYKISDKINLQLENQVSLTTSNTLDGTADLNTSGSLFENNAVNYLSIGINFNIGKQKSAPPLYWLNPLEYLYTEINAPRNIKIPEPHLYDTDKDGVADLLDKEENTLAGIPVDAKGITLDTDGDGVPDYKDQELITPSFCLPSDAYGVGTCPKSETCCQSVLDRLKELESGGQLNPTKKPLRLDTFNSAPEVSTPKSITEVNTNCYVSNLINSLSNQITFNVNSVIVNEKSENILNNITEVFKQNKKLTILIQGKYYPYERPDSIKYLFEERRNFISDFLTAKGIDETRIKMLPFESADMKETYISLNEDETGNCTKVNVKNCNLPIVETIFDANYLSIYNSLNEINKDVSFKKGNILAENFKEKYQEKIIDILNNNPNYLLVVSAPYDNILYNSDATAESKQSSLRGDSLKNILLQKGLNTNQIVVVPVNFLQPTGTIATFRVIQDKNIDSDQDCIPDIKDKCPTIKGEHEYSGCLTSPDLIDSFNNISKNILFDFDKDNIKSSSFSYLDNLAKLINQNKFLITIAGKTDEIGEEEHNLELSYKRAISVKKYLTNKSVPEKYMQAIGLGEQPAITNTEEEKSFLRRVDFWINGIDR